MWSASFVIILYTLKLTHVNAQDDEFSFNATTSKTHAEALFDTTNKTLVEEDSFDASTNEIPVEEDSLDTSTSKIYSEKPFIYASSKTPVEEDSFDTSTGKTLVKGDSFDTSVSKPLVEEDSFDVSTSETPVEANSFDTSTSKTLIEENSFDTSIRKTLVEEDSLDTSTSKTLGEENSFDVSTNETPVEEDSFDKSTSKTLIEEDSFDTSTSEILEEENSFYVSINETPVEENSFDVSTNETPVEEDSFDKSTSKTLIEEDSFDTSTNETLGEENSFDVSISETPVEKNSFDVSTNETPVEEDCFDKSTRTTLVEEGSFEITTIKARIEEDEKMSTYILKVLEHYKQSDPQGFPGANMPDPLLVPDSSQFIAFGTNLDFTDTTLLGVNKFHIVNVTADIGKMECRAFFEMDKLQVRGKYSLNMWLSSYPGGFISDITGLKSEVVATLGVEEDGKLRAQNISIDITFKNITIQFENAGLLSSMLQGLFNSMGSILYDSIKSYLLEDAHTNMRDDINKKLDQIIGDIEFPNTISPMDMILVDVRKKIKDMKMDPLCVEDYVSNIGMFKIAINNIRIEGLSTFHRVRNIKIRLENNTAVSDFNIGTKELQGTTNWEVSGMNGLLNKTGSFSFSVAYVQGRLVLVQAMDTRKRMEFRDLQLDVGNIQIRSDGAGTLDYIIELTANILPTLLRYQIIAAIENPIRWKIQEELDRINIEEAIINELPKIDKMQEDGFQLALLRMLNSTDEINYDDDDFFNF